MKSFLPNSYSSIKLSQQETFTRIRSSMHMHVWGAQLQAWLQAQRPGQSTHSRAPGYQPLVPAHSIHFVCCVVPFFQKLSMARGVEHGTVQTGCDAYVQFAIAGNRKVKKISSNPHALPTQHWLPVKLPLFSLLFFSIALRWPNLLPHWEARLVWKEPRPTVLQCDNLHDD